MNDEELSNEELLAIAAGDELSNEELMQIAGIQPETSQQGLMTEAFRSGANIATGGYLPEIQGAIASRSLFSGPEYEKQKRLAQLELKRGQISSPGAAAIGGVVGAVASPLNLLPLAGARTAGRLGAVAGSALQGAAINPGDVENQLRARLEQAGVGGALGLAGEGVSALAPKLKRSAERAAVSGIRPFKAAVKDLTKSGQIEKTGRVLLDEGIIGNIPRGGEKLLERVEKGLETVGAKKGAMIDALDAKLSEFAAGSSAVPYGTKGKSASSQGVNLDKLRADILDSLRLDSAIPGSQAYNDKLALKVQEISPNKKTLSLKEADKLKTQIGALVKRWYPNNAPKTDLSNEEFYRSLYSALNKGVDDGAELIAKQYNPHALDELRDLKNRYGGLKSAEKILTEREIADFANRMVSPSDYGVGATGAVIGATQGGLGGAALAATAGAGINNFLRKFGNQITSKQLDNLSKIMASPIAKGLGVGALTSGTIDIPRSKRLKALEE